MNWRRILIGLALAMAIVALTTLQARAQIFSKRPAPPPPQQRVPELLKIVKEDGDENKRLEAVDELRGMDITKFPEIAPALVEAMLNDKKPSVRAEAAYAVGRYRPIQHFIGSALEQVRDHDVSMRVRLQARTTLVSYYLAGYRSNKMDDPKQTPLPPNGTNKEPPLAPGPGTSGIPLPPVNTTAPPRLTPMQTTPIPVPGTGPNLPPAPPPAVIEVPARPDYQPLPKGTTPAPLPLPAPSGPDLGSPR
jgi:hypothetical protein